MPPSLLERLLLRWRSFRSFLNLQATISIFSTEEKEKTLSKILRYQTILILIVLVFIITVSAAHFLFTREERTAILQKIVDSNEKKALKLAKLNSQIESINHYQQSYNKEINEIFYYFGNLNEASIWNMDLRDRELELESWSKFEAINSVNLNSSIKELNRNRLKLMVHLKHLKDIGNFIDLRNDLIEHLPIGWPIAQNRGYKTSGYGPRISPFTKKKEFHTGIDIASGAGSYVLATAAGEVFISEEKTAFGKVVILKHRYGYNTIYSHNQVNLVKAGEKVKKFQKIAQVGMTGRATGAHLHYAIRIGSQHVDPWDYLIAKF